MKILRLFLFVFLSLLISCRSSPKHYVSFSSIEELQSYLSWSPEKAPLIGAHRGGPEAGFPENCIETFENALKYAPCLIEMDIRKTKDSVLVLMHDETLDRATTGSGRVDDYTLQQLKMLRLKDPFEKVTNYQIPTLTEILEWGRGKAILQLDVKPGVSPREIVEAIAAHEAEAYCLVIGYTLEDAQEYHRLNPRLMISAPAQGMEAARRLLESGIQKQNLLGFVGIEAPPGELYDLLHRQGIRAILGTIGNLDRKAETGGIEVYIELLKNGADVLATDNVPLTSQAIKKFMGER